jgi:DNA polymerase (family 10)
MRREKAFCRETSQGGAARYYPHHTRGDFRRGSELARDLSLVAEVRKLPGGPKAITAGGQLTARLTDAAHYGVTLLLATGSDAHLADLRALAAKKNMILDEKGLRRGAKVVAAATEDAIYKALGMQTVPPELRERGFSFQISCSSIRRRA